MMASIFYLRSQLVSFGFLLGSGPRRFPEGSFLKGVCYHPRYCSGKNQTVKTLAEVKEKAKGGRASEGRERKRGLMRQNSTVHPQITYIPTEKEVGGGFK